MTVLLRSIRTNTACEQQAVDFLKESGTKMRIVYVDTVQGFPFDDKDKYPHHKYIVTLKRNKRQYSFPFYNSYAAYQAKTRPSKYDVLACLEKYDVGEMSDFVEEFGYKIVDRKSFLKVEGIWRECREQYQNLRVLFDDEWMEKLQEIN